MIRFGSSILLALGCLLAMPATSPGASITVNTTLDEFATGPACSLREAVWASNNDSNTQAPGCVAGSGEPDLIRLPAGVFWLTRPNSSTNDEDASIYGDLDVTGAASIVHEGPLPAVIVDKVHDRVLHNTAAGDGGLSLAGVTIEDGAAPVGAGILNEGRLQITDTTITGNSADSGGGGIASSGPLVLTNVTISGNGANEGGGIYVAAGGRVRLSSVTVAHNRSRQGDGGGAFVSSSGLLRLQSTLLAGNDDAGGEAFDCATIGDGQVASAGHNLIGNGNGCRYRPGVGDLLNRSAKVLGLSDNGGPTATVPLLESSPAIDNGANCGRFDQRGLPRRLGADCDIGAWELVRCQGVVVNRIGTAGPDLLLGTSGDDGFLAFGGADTMRGLDGEDGLCGGAGSDRLEGGEDDDALDGGPGRDTCFPGAGRNTVIRCEARG